MSDRLLVATRKGLFTLERNGTKSATPWQITRTEFLASTVWIVYPDNRNGQVYAAIGHGHFGPKLHRSADGGASWAECAAPKYPDPPAGAEDDLCPMSGRKIPWNLDRIWSLSAGGEDQPDVLWCGTVPGGLFRSDDRGSSWQMNRPLWDMPQRKKWFGGGLDYPGIHSICVDPRNSNRVIVGVSCGGVWITDDGGDSWNCRADGMWAAYMPPESKNDPGIQDPHLLVQCAANPDAMWVQHHNGIFHTIDGGVSWQECENVMPSNFGFAVAVHPKDASTAWFVPAIKDEERIPVDGKVVVTRTRDGGKTFQTLRNGLPQDHAYDLTFRHALDVNETGDRLAFGSTTDSLWTTDDQGESWQCASTNLPPIYSVRFLSDG